MADLSAYEDLNDIEFSQEVKQLMELFAESWEECRSDECGACKYRHGKKHYRMLLCMSERYAEKLIANDVAPVRHSYWETYITPQYMGLDDFYEPKFRDGRLFICHERQCRYKTVIRSNYCPKCGAKMDGGVDK